MRRGRARSPGPRRLLGAALVTLAVLASAAGPVDAQALRAPAGVPVRAGDPDAFPGPLLALPAPAYCLLEPPAGDGEVVVLAAGGCAAGRVRAHDVRLSGPLAGKVLAEGDPELRAMAQPLPGTVRFADLTKDGQWSRGDAAYLHRSGNATAVAPGDVRLTPAANASAGSVVRAADPDAGRATTAAVSSGTFDGRAAAWRAWDADRDGAFGAGDLLYADLDGSADLSVGDVHGTAAAGRPYGALAAAGDPGVRPRLSAFGPAAGLCFVDRDGDREHDPGEAVYFRYEGCPLAAGGAAAATLRPSDVRLSGPAAGSQVLAGDSDAGAAAWALPGGGNLRFADLGRDGRWSSGDPLYLHVAADRATVTQGDLRMTPYGAFAAGTAVLAGDSDLKFFTTGPSPGLAFHPSPQGWRFWDGDGDVRFGPADPLYMDLDGDGEVSLLDLRLGGIPGRAFGSAVLAGDPDLRPVLGPPSPVAALCFLDADGDQARDPAEGVLFLARACGKVQPGDVRLSDRAGARIAAADPEVNATASWLPGLNNVRFYDADDGKAWSLGDTLYLHLAPGGSAVAAGDLRLTAYGSLPSGTTVDGDDPDLRLPTTGSGVAAAPALHWRTWDVDRDPATMATDVLYVDTDGSGTVGVLDVRLTEFRRNLSAPGITVAQIPELQRTIESLEQVIAGQAERLREATARWEAQNRTLTAAQGEAAALAAENARLREALNATASAPPPADRSVPGPGPVAAAAGLALAAVAGARLRRR